MQTPRLSKFEMQVLETLWVHGPASVREVLDALPGKKRPAYTTVQTILTRLETKGAVSRVKKIGNAHVFRAELTRELMQRGALEHLLKLFGGRAQPVVSQLIQSGHLTAADIEEARKIVKEHSKPSMKR